MDIARFPRLADEEARLRALHALRLLDTPPEPAFDALAAMASHILDCPLSFVTLIDRTRQWIKAGPGNGVRETSREIAFCDHTIRESGPMIVEDAADDARFAGNPAVTGDPNIRFYAGMPLHAPDPESGMLQPVGAICGVDTVPRSITPDQRIALEQLGTVAEALLTARTVSGGSLKLAELAHAQAVALQRSVTAFRQAERIAAIGSWRYGIDDHALEWSEGLYRIHELSPDRTPDLDLALSFFPEDARCDVERGLAETQVSGRPFDLETDFVTAAGNVRRVRAMGELDQEEGGRSAVAGVFQDITARYQLEQSLRRLAELDEVTGIANRAAFNRALERAVQSAIGGGAPLLLALADLDHFKQINDVNGHAAGDDVLKAVADRLRAAAGAGCFPARLGGDEFALIVQDPAACACPEPFVAALLARLNQPVETAFGSLPVSVTIGYGLFENHRDATLREFVHRIDSTLYAAKRTGRGSAQRYAVSGRRASDR